MIFPMYSAVIAPVARIYQFVAIALRSWILHDIVVLQLNGRRGLPGDRPGDSDEPYLAFASPDKTRHGSSRGLHQE